MDIQITAGTTLSVAAARPLTIDQGGFEVLVYTQVRGVRTVGDIGTQRQTVEDRTMGKVPRNRVVGRNPSSLALELYRITNPGQDIMLAAVDENMSYSYCVQDVRGVKKYFTAAVSGHLGGIGDAKSIGDTKISMELDSIVITAI